MPGLLMPCSVPGTAATPVLLMNPTPSPRLSRVPMWASAQLGFSNPCGVLETLTPACACCSNFWGKPHLFRTSCKQVLLLQRNLALKKVSEEMRRMEAGQCLLSISQEIMNKKKSAELQQQQFEH